MLPFHTLAEAVPVPQQSHLAQWEQQQDQQQQEDQQVLPDQQQQVLQGLKGLQVSLPQQQPEGRLSQPSSPMPGLQQQQQRWSAVGLDDSGQPVSDWDYLNRCDVGMLGTRSYRQE